MLYLRISWKGKRMEKVFCVCEEVSRILQYFLTLPVLTYSPSCCKTDWYESPSDLKKPQTDGRLITKEPKDFGNEPEAGEQGETRLH